MENGKENEGKTPNLNDVINCLWNSGQNCCICFILAIRCVDISDGQTFSCGTRCPSNAIVFILRTNSLDRPLTTTRCSLRINACA